MKKIVLIDRDSDQASIIKDQLEVDQRYIVDVVENLADMEWLAPLHRISAILVNIETTCDGFEEFSILQNLSGDISALALLCSDSDPDFVAQITDVFDQVLFKPTKLTVLLERLELQISRKESDGAASYSIANYTFRPREKLLIETSTGKPTRLTEKETEILGKLYFADGEIITRKILLKDVWGYSERVSSHTLETHIYRLRKKIERNSSDESILITTEGGYRLALQ